MIEMKISGETADQFKANLHDTFKALLPVFVMLEKQRAAPAASADIVVEQTASEELNAESKAHREEMKTEPKVEEQKTEAPKARGRKKAEPEAEKQVDLEEAIAEKAKAPEPPIEDIRAALQSLAKSKGDDAVWELLNKHKCKGATAVKDAGKGAIVVAECAALEAA